ncbi:MAG: hypothetical protein SGBAC_003758 [Bacillariaceae sp.]
MTDFKVMDPVLLRLPASADAEGQTLEGVVAVIGISCVGVRLTGSSVGMGNISDKMGNLQCPPNGGVYVDFPDNNANPAEQVLRKRKVSRLEELRLRRELAATPLATTNKTAADGRTGTGNTSRLEELRQRRELALLSSSTTRTTTRLEELRQRQELMEHTSISNPTDPPESAYLLQQNPTDNGYSPHAKVEFIIETLPSHLICLWFHFMTDSSS